LRFKSNSYFAITEKKEVYIMVNSAAINYA
jgi:hypothetical protein